MYKKPVNIKQRHQQMAFAGKPPYTCVGFLVSSGFEVGTVCPAASCRSV